MAYSEPIAPLPVQTPPKRRNLVLIVSMVLLLVFLMGAGCVALFLSGSKAVNGAKIPADRFLTALEKPDYAAAREMLSGEAKQATTQNTITDVMEVLQKRRGKAVSHSESQSFNVKTYNGVTQVQLTYQETFADKSQTPVRLVLTPERQHLESSVLTREHLIKSLFCARMKVWHEQKSISFLYRTPNGSNSSASPTITGTASANVTALRYFFYPSKATAIRKSPSRSAVTG